MQDQHSPHQHQKNQSPLSQICRLLFSVPASLEQNTPAPAAALQCRLSFCRMVLLYSVSNPPGWESACWQIGQEAILPLAPSLQASLTQELSLPQTDISRLPGMLPSSWRDEGFWHGIILSGPKGNKGLLLLCAEAAHGPFTSSEITWLKLLNPAYERILWGEPEPPAQEPPLQGWVLNEIINNVKLSLYVTDPETDHILFMNKTMKDTLGLKAPEGQVCWKVLQPHGEGRCPSCPVGRLLEGGENHPSCLWESRSQLNDRIYEHYDSLMHWIDGRVVHFQQSSDVTEKHQLRREAKVDELTGIYNRRAGKEALSKAILDCREQGCCLSVCMYDINNLKSVNDTYGHGEGDALLSRVAGFTKTVLGSGSFALRLSGDEFIIVFPCLGEKAADQKVRAVLQLLKEQEELHKIPYHQDFSYGILTIQPDDRYTLEEVLALADERMYAQKRQHHICQAQLQHSSGVVVSSADDFIYDKDKLYDALVNSTDDYIFVCNLKTGTFRYSKSMVDEFDLPGEVIQNAAVVWDDKVHEQDRQAYLEANQEITDGRTSRYSVEYRAKNRRGEWVWLRCRGHMERDDQGRPTLFVGIITNLGRKNRVDHLTGLYNKFECRSRVDQMVSDFTRRPFAILALGLDDFSRINELYDSLFGDEVIRIAAHKIQSHLSPSDLVYRMDGDEFVVLLKGGERREAADLYRRLQRAFETQHDVGGKKFFCTISGGCVYYPEHGTDSASLFKYASQSLEYAKAHGKNQLVFFSQKILQDKERSLTLTELLRESVSNGFEGFQLHYQPQVCGGSLKLFGAEALCRYRCPRFGPVSSSEFIPLLEESGLILPVGRWILETAIKTGLQWSKRRPGFVISVNLSCRQLEDPALPDFLAGLITRLGADPRFIILELTESCVASNYQLSSQIILRLRQMGFMLSMDDFGTGYSSLGILKYSPTDLVKIDQGFVRDILTSPFDATFIESIVNLCHKMKIRVCLEGVENPLQLEAVADMELDYMQGYLFGQPMSRQEFESLFLAE